MFFIWNPYLTGELIVLFVTLWNSNFEDVFPRVQGILVLRVFFYCVYGKIGGTSIFCHIYFYDILSYAASSIAGRFNAAKKLSETTLWLSELLLILQWKIFLAYCIEDFSVVAVRKIKWYKIIQHEEFGFRVKRKMLFRNNFDVDKPSKVTFLLEFSWLHNIDKKPLEYPIYWTYYLGMQLMYCVHLPLCSCCLGPKLNFCFGFLPHCNSFQTSLQC